ncbi:MAG: hypothetical protein KAR15_02650, partial [Desulfobacterales bacterium]|nr:hypothetical protein [Desulfobacterales bacterium]
GLDGGAGRVGRCFSAWFWEDVNEGQRQKIVLFIQLQIRGIGNILVPLIYMKLQGYGISNYAKDVI